MRRRLLLLLCGAWLVLSGSGIVCAVPYYFTGLSPAGTDTVAWAYAVATVNGSPEAVGYSRTSTANQTPVVWSSSGTPTDLLPLLPGASAGSVDQANAVDTNGDVAGATLVGSLQALLPAQRRRRNDTSHARRDGWQSAPPLSTISAW